MLNGAQCVNGACACISGHHYLHGRCWKSRAGEACNWDLDCPPSSSCSATFICQPAEEVVTAVKTVSFKSSYVARECAKDCISDNMECTPGGQCVCQPGYVMQESGNCLAELGEPCATVDDCLQGDNVTCRGGICSCDGGFAVLSSNRKCDKSRKHAFNCADSAQCSYYGGECVNKKCACPQGTRFLDATLPCWPIRGLGDNCTDDRDCSVESGVGVYCDTNSSTCTCQEGFHSTNNADCWKNVTELGDKCEQDAECDFSLQGRFTACSEGVCACVDGYIPQNSTECVVAKGGPCTQDEDCEAVSGYICQKEICACPEGTIPSTDELTCLAVATSDGANCTELSQCTTVLGEHLECKDGACSCISGYHFRSNRCWETKNLEEECSKQSQCYLDENYELAECRNGQCLCRFGFISDSSRRLCLDEGSSRAQQIVSTAVTCFAILLWRALSLVL